MRKTVALHVRFTFWYISLPSSAKQQREMTKFGFFSRTWVYDDKFFFLFLCYNTVHSNLDPRQLAGIFHVKQIGIISKELKNEKLYFEMTFSLLSPSSFLQLPVVSTNSPSQDHIYLGECFVKLQCMIWRVGSKYLLTYTRTQTNALNDLTDFLLVQLSFKVPCVILRILPYFP